MRQVPSQSRPNVTSISQSKDFVIHDRRTCSYMYVFGLWIYRSNYAIIDSRQADRTAYRQTNRQIDRKTGPQTDLETDIQTNKQPRRHTNTDRQ